MSTNNRNYFAVVEIMIAERFTKDNLDHLPFGIALPLKEALRNCRYEPSAKWPAEAYILIGKQWIIFNYILKVRIAIE